MKKILFIGDCGNFKDTSNGVYAKNIQLLGRLHEMFVSVKHVNTSNWKLNPCVILKIVCLIWQYRKRNIIISLNTYSAYKLIKAVWLLFPSVRINYFVVGGILPDFISSKKTAQRKCYSAVKWFLVESVKMQSDIEQLGYNNVIHVPNFKKIGDVTTPKAKESGVVKFVFLSRIIPEKGCGLIIEATNMLNKKMCGKKFVVHFYGKVDGHYETQFTKDIVGIDNVEYKGFLNMADHKNYGVLATYSAMLFPTFWKGEGFPGVLIDAMVSGVPVIASDWGYNTEIIENGRTGLIIQSKDASALANAMMSFIDNPTMSEEMSVHCYKKAMDYDTQKVLNNDLFKKILSI